MSNWLSRLAKTATFSASGPIPAGHSSWNASAAPLVATLPALTGSGSAATALAAGKTVRVKISKSKSDITLNAVTVTCAGTDTMQGGSTSQPLTVGGEKITLSAEIVPGNSTAVWVVDEHAAPPDTLLARAAAGAINVVARGAKPDSGVTDNQPIIQKAILDAYNAGGGVVVVPPAANDTAYYGIASCLVVYSGVVLWLQGPRAVLKSTTTDHSYNGNVIVYMGNYGGYGATNDVFHEQSFPLAVDAHRGDRTVTLASGKGASFTVGALIALASSAIRPGSVGASDGTKPLNSMMNEVLSVTGDVVTLRHALPDDYVTTGGVPSNAYFVNTNPFLADGGPVGADGATRAFLAKGAKVIGGGKIIASDWALTQEVRGECLRLGTYECEWDIIGIGAIIAAGDPVAYSTGRINGRYRYSAFELGYLSNNTEAWVSGQRFGPDRVSNTECFAVYLDGEGVTDCTIHLGTITHYDAISVYATIQDAGTRNRITGGIIYGTQPNAPATCQWGTDAVGGIFEDITVVQAAQYGFRAPAVAGAGIIRRCKVLNSNPGYAAIHIESGNATVCYDNDLGNPASPQAMDVILDDNVIPGPHRGNRSRLSLQRKWITQLSATLSPTTKTSVAAYTLAANQMPPAGALRIIAMGRVRSTSTAGTKSVSLEFAGVVLASLSYTAAQTGYFCIEGILVNYLNSGTTPTQTFFGSIRTVINGVPTVTPIFVELAIDTTVLHGINLYYTVANAADQMYRQFWLVESVTTDQIVNIASS